MTKVAIVGAGAAGCYSAQAIIRRLPDAELVLLERLSVPFGLIRHGVAPDHQGTKAVSRQFERVFDAPQVTLITGVDVGGEVSVDDLREAFDVVVMATGLSRDRDLGIPGSRLSGVVGSGEFTRALNGHPDQFDAEPRIGVTPVVVGAGNVALDVVRLLAKAPADFEGSDLDDDLLSTIVPSPVRRIDLVARGWRPRWDEAMLKEILDIDGAEVHVAGGDQAARRAGLSHIVGVERTGSARVDIVLHFGRTPVAVRGDQRVVGIDVADESGALLTIPTDTVITAVGFESESFREDARLITAGWLATGARGTIPEQRSRARDVAERVAAVPPLPERGGLDALPSVARGGRTGVALWRAIDDLERTAAGPSRCRRKLRDPAQHAAVLARVESSLQERKDPA
ncbi:FAD-dependent oxidoreductase [Microbacterium sp. P5_E9]